VHGRDFGEGNADVLETPQEFLTLKEESKQWRFGMGGHGIDLPCMVWPHMTHTFSSQLRNARESLPGMPEAQVELGPAHEVQHNVLDQHPVDMRLVDDISEDGWSPWLTKCKLSHRPQAVTWSGPPDLLIADAAGPARKSFQKKMTRAGCELARWTMAAETHEAALAQDRLVVVCTLGKSKEGPLEPQGDDVPPRSMSNLPRPTGAPHKVWYQGRTQSAPESARWWPCEVTCRARKQEPINDHHGLRPDLPGCWIASERGTRRLQSPELAKAKGVPNEWTTGGSGTSRPLTRVEVRACTGIHVWTATMDATLTWVCREQKWLNGKASEPAAVPPTKAEAAPDPRHEADVNPNKAPGPCAPPSAGSSPRAETPGPDEEWTWEVPDLRPGSS
jgi:hypothetical protein